MSKDTVARLADHIFRGLEDQCKLRNQRGGHGHDEHGRPELLWIVHVLDREHGARGPRQAPGHDGVDPPRGDDGLRALGLHPQVRHLLRRACAAVRRCEAGSTVSLLDFPPFSPRRRVIDRLRRLYPGKWTYDMLDRLWSHESGWSVRACAALASRYDGDDDNFVTQYRRTDTGELVL